MKVVNCTCFIVPSKLLRSLANKAQGAERDALLDSALLSEHLRGHRTARALKLVANSGRESK